MRKLLFCCPSPRYRGTWERGMGRVGIALRSRVSGMSGVLSPLCGSEGLGSTDAKGLSERKALVGGFGVDRSWNRRFPQLCPAPTKH